LGIEKYNPMGDSESDEEVRQSVF